MDLEANNLPKIQFIKQPESFGSKIVGDVYQQMTPFQWYEHDWNNDGDVYDEKVAKFQKVSDVNLHSGNYLILSEWEFRELKDEGCIAYVKEQYISGKIKRPLNKQMSDAALKAGISSGISGRTGREGHEER